MGRQTAPTACSCHGTAQAAACQPSVEVCRACFMGKLPAQIGEPRPCRPRRKGSCRLSLGQTARVVLDTRRLAASHDSTFSQGGCPHSAKPALGRPSQPAADHAARAHRRQRLCNQICGQRRIFEIARNLSAYGFAVLDFRPLGLITVRILGIQEIGGAFRIHAQSIACPVAYRIAVFIQTDKVGCRIGQADCRIRNGDRALYSRNGQIRGIVPPRSFGFYYPPVIQSTVKRLPFLFGMVLFGQIQILVKLPGKRFHNTDSSNKQPVFSLIGDTNLTLNL